MLQLLQKMQQLNMQGIYMYSERQSAHAFRPAAFAVLPSAVCAYPRRTVVDRKPADCRGTNSARAGSYSGKRIAAHDTELPVSVAPLTE